MVPFGCVDSLSRLQEEPNPQSAQSPTISSRDAEALGTYILGVWMLSDLQRAGDDCCGKAKGPRCRMEPCGETGCVTAGGRRIRRGVTYYEIRDCVAECSTQRLATMSVG
jgi:hypothetical protein